MQFFFVLAALGLCCCTRAFLWLWRAGATLCCSAQASHCSGFSCGAWAQQLWLVGSRAQAQQLWCTGLVAPQHVGSSRTRVRTHVPCVGRWIPNHCATREALQYSIVNYSHHAVYSTSPGLMYLITGSVYLLTPFIHFASTSHHLLPRHLWQPPIYSLYL